MSTTVSSPRSGKPQPEDASAKAGAALASKPVSWRTPAMLTAFGLIALVFFLSLIHI